MSNTSALAWWDNLDQAAQQALTDQCYSGKDSETLTTNEIRLIWERYQFDQDSY